MTKTDKVSYKKICIDNLQPYSMLTDKAWRNLSPNMTPLCNAVCLIIVQCI